MTKLIGELAYNFGAEMMAAPCHHAEAMQ
jgi:hypothetical protein